MRKAVLNRFSHIGALKRKKNVSYFDRVIGTWNQAAQRVLCSDKSPLFRYYDRLPERLTELGCGIYQHAKCRLPTATVFSTECLSM